MASSDLPPYESLVASLLIPEEVTPEKVQSAVIALHSSPQAPIVAATFANDELQVPTLTPDQITKYAYGVVEYMSSPYADIPIRITAAIASGAAQAVDGAFDTLTKAVDGLDAKKIPPPEGDFGPRIRAIHNDFRATLRQSTKIALDVADYGEEFEDKVLKLAKDESLSVADRVRKIQEFIGKADSISQAAQTLAGSFDTIKSKLATFNGSLSGWARNKEQQDSDKLATARRELEGLNTKLNNLQKAFTATASVAAASLPVTGILGILAGPFAPFVIIGGLAVAGASTAATVALSAEITSVKSEVSAKKTEVENLEKAIQDIKEARGNAELTGTATLALFDANLSILSLIWTSVKNDCTKIIEWLQQGQKDADLPLYMKISLDQAVGVYKALAKFLRGYVDGISKI